MRWKLLTFASLVAALVGTSACFAAARFLPDPSRGWAGTAAFIVPVAATAAASVFVYRHTARRRTLQAAATALLAALLTLAALLVVSLVARRPPPELLPAPLPAAKAS